jgi:UDPglucose 6-dehydrogenase
MKIGFIGMSHLGICHAVAAAEKGFIVKCFDESLYKIEQLSKGFIDFFEPNLDKTFKKNKKKIKFVHDLIDLKECDLVFFSKDIPTNNKDKSLYDGIYKLIKRAIRHLNKKSTLIILSQVKPGFTDSVKWSKKNLYYQVETLIFGEAVNRALKPEQFIVGAFDNKINKKYLKFLKSYKSRINIMNYKSAELAKISINLYLISSLSFTNSLAEACEKIDADWSKIQPILKQDKRIGKYAYLNPGLGILSGNLQRDLQSYKKILSENDCNLEIPKAWQKNSNYRKNWVNNLLNNELKYFLKKKIGIYGLTYKKDITILKNSPAISTIKEFKKTKFNVYDPKVFKKNFNLKNAVVYSDLAKFLKSSHLLIILTDWDEIKNCKYNILLNYKGKKIIDPYRAIQSKRFIENKKIYSLANKIK